MSDRHFFHDKSALVDQFLSGFAATRPDLHLKRSARVLHRAWRDTTKVALISGGGAGHEPGAAGMVGRGGLDAAVIGEIFASPRAEQVLAAITAVPSERGTILITPNYTGDNLHFSLARYMAKSQGINNVELVVVGDDISLPRSKNVLVGRRCLAGIIIVYKILGAASEEGVEFDQIVRLGRAMSTAMASVCVALDHCHIPGRNGGQNIDTGQVEIGLGLHNEKGVTTMAQPQPELLMRRLLDLLLIQSDVEQDHLINSPGDMLVLIVNNQGGMSVLEMGALLDAALTELAQRGIVPIRSMCGSFMGSMNMPGFSLTLLNVSTLAESCGFVTNNQILQMFDASHDCSSWSTPSQVLYSEQHAHMSSRPPSPRVWMGSTRILPTLNDFSVRVDPTRAKVTIRGACLGLMRIEKELTEWDTVVGDGDCGDTCSIGAKAVLAALDAGLGDDGNLIVIFRRLTEIIQGTCGGTLGAISAVFLGGMTAALCDAALLGISMSSSIFGAIAVDGLQCVKERTTARVGHRTIMDALIPFCATLSATGGLSQAVEAAGKGAESTRTLQPRLGRAAYVSKQAMISMTPDPGAMAFVAVVQGIRAALAN